MWQYIVRRILYVVPILLGITLLTFVLFNVVGRNPALLQAGKYATVDQIKSIEHELGLDLPRHEQYFNYLKQIVTLDFGRSWSTKQLITTMLVDGVGASLSLALTAFIFSTIISLVIALAAAYFRGTKFDKMILVTCLVGVSFPFLAIILAFQYFGSFKLGWFPISGYESGFAERWQYLTLPIIIWIFGSFGSEVLFFRTVIIEEIYQDYVRTARSKGLDYRTIYFRHILKNAMIPIITVVVLEIPFLYTGSFFLEAFFGIPGLGGMMLTAIQNSDFPVIKAMTFIGAALYVAATTLADIAYAFVDPRIKLG